VELKLASGMTNASRMKDLTDVLELIKTLKLHADFADQLNPFVRTKYMELWNQGKPGMEEEREYLDEEDDEATEPAV
jgi:hypothetical protein